MFAYCGNNPIIRDDCSGQFWGLAIIGIKLVAIAVSALAIAEVGYNHISESNYKNNSKLDNNVNTTTQNKFILDQDIEPASNFEFGIFYHASYNGCEAIALHNAKILKGMNSNLSQTIRDFQNSRAMIGYGLFGSAPNAIANVLNNNGIAYSSVSIEGMTKKGTYIFSYWNSTDIFSGLHTIAISYDGNKFYGYNYMHGYNEISPSKYSDRFICCYYLE